MNILRAKRRRAGGATLVGRITRLAYKPTAGERAAERLAARSPLDGVIDDLVATKHTGDRGAKREAIVQAARRITDNAEFDQAQPEAEKVAKNVINRFLSQGKAGPRDAEMVELLGKLEGSIDDRRC